MLPMESCPPPVSALLNHAIGMAQRRFVMVNAIPARLSLPVRIAEMGRRVLLAARNTAASSERYYV